MKSRALVAASTLVLLGGCGQPAEKSAGIDRALLYAFPDEPAKAVSVAARLRADGEKVGGSCAKATAHLHETAEQLQRDTDAIDTQLDLDPMSTDVQKSVAKKSETYGTMLDAVKTAKADCPVR